MRKKPTKLPLQLNPMAKTTTDPLTLSEKAAEKVKELLADQEGGDEQALRVAVRGGGCSGFEYALSFDRRRDDDHVLEYDGVSLIVDPVSMRFVFGSEVDYVEGLQGAGFAVNNPNVEAACGCGQSFRVREDAEEGAAV
jgi:iron-sulfur cluster assembly protein